MFQVNRNMTVCDTKQVHGINEILTFFQTQNMNTLQHSLVTLTTIHIFPRFSLI